MPSSFDDVNAKCPFFSSSGSERIICEGITDSCITIQKFKGKSSRTEHREMFCDSHYNKCYMYQALYSKYE